MESKKNIWIINQYTGSPYYGMNYRSYYLGKEFIDKGDDVTIFAGSYSHLFVNHPKTKGLFTEEIIDGINYIWVKTSKYKNSKSIGRILNMIIFMINLFFFNIFKMKKPDIIIISSLSLFPILNAYIWSKIFKIEFILEVRDIWPLTLVELNNVSKYHPLVLLLGLFERLGYRKAKYVVSVLPNAKEHMINNNMSESKFKHIPNGINLEEVENYQEINDDVKKLIPQDKFIIGYLGTIGIANALEYLVMAAKELKNNNNIQFLIIGKGGEKEKLEQFCLINKLQNVIFIDPIPKIQVQGILKLLDVCFIGAHKHNLYKYGVSANKIFDYMYGAKPIIYAIDSPNDLITTAQCGIKVSAENSNDIKDAILDLSSKSKKNLEEMGRNGKRYVIENHSYTQLSAIYKKLMI